MNKHRINLCQQLVTKLKDTSCRVHHDQRGTISIFTVFSLLMFTMVLIMIVNVGRHVDDKVKMQNAADAATYSGGVVIARGMNGVAFTNHLLCDVFAITAYLREGRDRNAEQLIPQILEAWNEAGQQFGRAEFEKFQQLSPAIIDKVPKEQNTVTAFGEMTAAASEFALPVFEYILGPPSQTPEIDEEDVALNPPGENDSELPTSPPESEGQGGHLLPDFQRAMVRMIPEMAQDVTREIARRHGMPMGEYTGSQSYLSQTPRGEQSGALWRTTVETVGYSNEEDPLSRTLPVIDPDPSEGDVNVASIDEYRNESRNRRRSLARHYLNLWNNDKLRLFRDEAKMSQFFNLWVTATCAQLNRLLEEEYRDTNLPMMLRRTDGNRNVEGIITDAEMENFTNPNGDVVRRRVYNRRNENQFDLVTGRVRSSMNVDDYIERDFNFVGVVSRRLLDEMGPGLFKNPIENRSDAHTYAQVSVFVPRPRHYLRYAGTGGGSGNGGSTNLGGTFGIDVNFQDDFQFGSGGDGQPPPPENQRWPLENWPTNWDLFNQNWTVKIVPATAQNLLDILQRDPAGQSANVVRPYFRNVSGREFRSINNH